MVKKIVFIVYLHKMSILGFFSEPVIPGKRVAGNEAREQIIASNQGYST